MIFFTQFYPLIYAYFLNFPITRKEFILFFLKIIMYDYLLYL